MQPRPGRTSPRNCQGFMGCRPVGRKRQDASHTARSCFVCPRHLPRVTYVLAHGWAYCKRAEGPLRFLAGARKGRQVISAVPIKGTKRGEYNKQTPGGTLKKNR